MVRRKTLLSWSSGKDSAWALHLLRQNLDVEVSGLFTVVNQAYQRVSMHATRMDLLHCQAEGVDLPLQIISLPDPCTNEECDAIMSVFVTDSASKGIDCMAYGDLFLEDVRHYREDQLRGAGIDPLFPVWGIPTKVLAEQMLAAGLEAYVSSVDLKKLPARFAGRRWGKDLIAEFPESTDPCGENGEIHTIVVGGPMLRETIPVTIGATVERDGFAYADIIPSGR
jgi:uncharacterized protein (TIGR00290 family)